MRPVTCRSERSKCNLGCKSAGSRPAIDLRADIGEGGGGLLRVASPRCWAPYVSPFRQWQELALLRRLSEDMQRRADASHCNATMKASTRRLRKFNVHGIRYLTALS
jgi:hypothetical protein